MIDNSFLVVLYSKMLLILRGPTLRLECINRKPENGAFRCRISCKDGLYTQIGTHNHEPTADEQHRAAVVNDCLGIADLPRETKGPKQIYEQDRRNHLEAVIAFNPTLERRIQRKIASVRPRAPMSIVEILALMEVHPEYK